MHSGYFSNTWSAFVLLLSVIAENLPIRDNLEIQQFH